MISKNKIEITVIEEFGEYVGSFGQFSVEDVQKLIHAAETYGMSCLGFVDIAGNTYFNEIQCKEIKEELKILQEKNEVNHVLLDSLSKAAEKALKEEAYLVVNGL